MLSSATNGGMKKQKAALSIESASFAKKLRGIDGEDNKNPCVEGMR